ncbi:hypothetical protein GCM10011490_02590 [Pseudoclavibacter endophyticus]|uniref:hypothetical protein n=1 Tax=Pseudoclavibacter endophyticus TaxID=1778590 RepID=UPI0016648079|nr:hypothetical protein [Pseudoclavibacter endophyticus]GGA56220.1 hypothetical protein GCM10011490_02590 [Pseudoclavibacter endophyticus]
MLERDLAANDRAQLVSALDTIRARATTLIDADSETFRAETPDTEATPATEPPANGPGER